MLLGPAWQTELWLSVDALNVAMRLDDALMTKRAARESARLSTEVESMKPYARYARGMYMVMRGRYRTAIELLESNEEPLARMGWLRTRAMLARAYNGLGEHSRAREIATDALARVSADDRRYVRVGTLNLALELALSEAALKKGASARTRVDELLRFHGPQNAPLTLGAIHEVAAKVALMAGEPTVARAHLDRFADLVRPTEIPAWTDRIEAMEEMFSELGQDRQGDVTSSELAPNQWTPSREVIPGVESPLDDEEECEAQATFGRVQG